MLLILYSLIVSFVVFRYMWLKYVNNGMIWNKGESCKIEIGMIGELWFREVKNLGFSKGDWIYSGDVQVIEIDKLNIKRIGKVTNMIRGDLIEYKIV